METDGFLFICAGQNYYNEKITILWKLLRAIICFLISSYQGIYILKNLDFMGK